MVCERDGGSRVGGSGTVVAAARAGGAGWVADLLGTLPVGCAGTQLTRLARSSYRSAWQ